ncbi:hypothetical protein QTP88_024478 [Uroleucon formosanum]
MIYIYGDRTPKGCRVAGAVLINNVVRDTHTPFVGGRWLGVGGAVSLRSVGGGGLGGGNYCENRSPRVSHGRAQPVTIARRRERNVMCACGAAPDVSTAASRKLTPLSTTETY